MFNWKIPLLFVIFMIGSGGAFFFLTPSPKKQVEKALFHIKNKNFSAAEHTLKSLPPSATFLPQSLYYGYLEQTRGYFDLSDRYFQAAFLEAKKSDDQKLLLEILMARASNAFYEQRDADFFSLMSSASNSRANSQFFKFFEGLERYLKYDYAEALRLWNAYSPCDMGEWMVFSIDRLFPEVWKKLHIAHCMIEEGDLLGGREILEKINHQLMDNHQELHHLATLLLGLSYIKESHQVSCDQRGSYYKLARFYFGQAQMGEFFPREKTRLITHVEKEAQELLCIGDDKAKREWGFDFVRTLQEWKAQNSIRHLANHLAEVIVKDALASNKDQKELESTSLCTYLRNEFLDTFFHQQLSEQVLFSLAYALKYGDSDNLFELWALVESLSSNPKVTAKEIASLTFDEILATIQKDNLFLSRTRYFIAFWEKLGATASMKELLARELLTHAKLFWYNEDQEKKGEMLMEIALEISEYNPLIEKEIAFFLTHLYVQAESSNMIHRLMLIYEAMEYFEINHNGLASKASLANHLADAEYLYGVGNYPGARTHASWVLKLDPRNQGANRLAGLCAFHLGEYESALCLLKELKNPDEISFKALILSQAFTIQEQGRHLCQIDTSDSFDE